MTSRAPLPPKAEEVERQYGAEADLYAEVRADVAEAMGHKQDAEEWDKVKKQVDRAQGGEVRPRQART